MRQLALFALLLTLVACKPQPSPNVFVDPALATLVPADTVFLAGVRMEQLSKTSFYQKYIANGKLKLVEEFKRETGLDPAKNFWEVLIASDAKTALVFVRGKFSEHGIEPKLDRPGVQRFSHKGYTLIGDEEAAVVFLNPTTAAAGNTAALRRLLDNRNNITGMPKALEQRITRIPSTNQAWFAANVAGRIPSAPGAMGAIVKLFESVQFATGQLDVRQKLRAQIAMECRSEQEAEKVRGAMTALLGMGRLNTPQEEGGGPQVFDQMQVLRERDVVRFSTDISFEELASSPFLAPLFGVK